MKRGFHLFPYIFRFPNVAHLSVRATGLQWLGQLHALAELRGLSSLNVLPEGNPIHGKIWREYAIYRLAHWGLKEINDEPVMVLNSQSLHCLILYFAYYFHLCTGD